MCDGVFFPPPLSSCPDTVGCETDDRSILLANVFQCSPGGFPVFQELLFVTERGLLLEGPTDVEENKFLKHLLNGSFWVTRGACGR